VINIWCAMLFILISYQHVTGQKTNLSNLEVHNFKLNQDTIIKSEGSIVPESVKISSQNGTNDISYKVYNNQISFKTPTVVDSISLQFRHMSINLGESQPAIDSLRMNTHERVIPIASDYSKEQYNNRRLIQSNKLEYTGSFSRGVSFGNTQDVVLNSNFNLQMKGDLGNGLFVRAAISDENIPIQPEGNTQVLQEFDKIFIEVKKDNTSVIAGDYELARPDSYFMNYFKKLKGVSIKSDNTLKGNWKVSNKGSFAVSRGKFRRQILTIREGNQGPYRLEGENGELFLQVLSGTEKVFADGKLLKRGENYDYIIDYNRAELSFTPQLIITANIRIIVEFEYAVQSYLRSLYATESVIENEKWQFGINIYNEQDSKSLASNLEFDSIDIANLELGGDTDIFRPSQFLLGPEIPQNTIKYKLDNNRLVYSPVDTSDVYGAVFTNFGDNNGSYVIDTSAAANGRVYRYIGENQGQYDPLIQLVAPEKKQLITFSGKYNLSDSTQVYFETGLSNNDKNRFSSVDNFDNTGIAFNSNFRDVRKIGNANKFQLESKLDYEYAHKDFAALNPYRNPEFFRDWNFDRNEETRDQNLYSTEFKFSKNLNHIKYGLSGFNNGTLYEGVKHLTELNITNKSWNLNVYGDLLNSTSTTETTSFFRPKASVRKNLFNNKWFIGGYFEKEKNIRKGIDDQVLNPISFNYDLYKIYLEKAALKNLSLSWSITQRNDDRVIDETLQNSTKSFDYEFGGNWKNQKNSDLEWRLVLRDYQVSENYSAIESSNRVFIGKIDHKLKLLNSGLTLNSYYESNSGQEPKVEFQYIKVQDGEGSYRWEDFNQDSLEQINEFILANFSDQGSYEKITVFNNEFISTNKVILNQSLKIDPKKIIKNKKAFLRKFLFTSRYRIDQKALNEGTSGKLISFINTGSTDSLVAFTNSFDHNIFFNRGNPNYDIQLSYRSINNKFTQISGFENRFNHQYYSRIRINLRKTFDALLETAVGEKHLNRENFEDQNFDIDFWNIIPQLNYRPTTKLRFVLKYKIEKNKNVRPGSNLEISNVNDIGLEVTWRQNTSSNLLLRFNYVKINFDGVQNSLVEFEMLQGLKDGNNMLWSLNYTRRISKNIDLILNYNGRKSEESRLVNIAGVQMRAIF